MKQFIFILFFCSFFAGMQEEGFAQNPECIQVYEIITPLRAPMFASPNMWRRMVGVEGMDRFIGALPLEDGALLAIGETQKISGAEILFVQMNRLGRVSFEKRDTQENLEQLRSVMFLDGQVLIIGQIKKKGKTGIGLFFYDRTGQFVSRKEFWDKKYDLSPEHIVKAKGGGGYLLGWAHTALENIENHTVLIRFSTKGSELWRRAYRMGVPNRLFSVSLLDNGNLIGSGNILLEDGRMGGWLVRIGEDGGMQWRRTYPRGRFAKLQSVKPLSNGNFVAVGESLPSTGNDSAGWILTVDDVGTPVWQRFYTGRYAYHSRDLSVEKDGRMSVLMNAEPIKQQSAGRSHVRLLTLSMEGYTLRDDAYIEGAHSEAFSLIRQDDGVRYVAGMAQTGYADPDNKKDKTMTTYDAWMMAVPSLEKYVDPCHE